MPYETPVSSMPVAISLLTTTVLIITASGIQNSGFPECPCLSEASELAAAIKPYMANAPDYGLKGCMPYDLNLDYPVGCTRKKAVTCIVDCKRNIHPYCRSKWCYVDPSICGSNETKCIEAGGRMGNTSADLSCGERKFTQSIHVSALAYSYATCGYLDDFTGESIKSAMDRILHVATVANKWPTGGTQGEFDVLRPELKGWRGDLIEFFHDMVKDFFDPPPDIVLNTSWATKNSRGIVNAMYNTSSSYTACVLDVAVGTYDICIAHIWYTAMRGTITSFTPPIFDDDFVLIVHKHRERYFFSWDSLKDSLAKPFAPFTSQAWAVLSMFLTFAAMSVYVVDRPSLVNADFPYPAKGWRFIRAGKAVYLSLLGFFVAAPELRAPTLPSKIVKIGLALFFFVNTASYTANEAAILVESAVLKPKITSMDSAIEQKVKICVYLYDVVKQDLLSRYPGLENLVIPVDKEDEFWRMLHDKRCHAGVHLTWTWRRAQSGEFAAADCTHPDESVQKFCKRKGNGAVDLQRDCSTFMEVGGVVVSIPVAWPVSKHVARSMEVATTEKLSLGDWAKKIKGKGPTSKCSAETETDDVAMPASNMAGIVAISSVIIVIGLMLGLVESFTGKHIVDLLGYSYDARDFQEEDAMAGVTSEVRVSRIPVRAGAIQDKEKPEGFDFELGSGDGRGDWGKIHQL